MIAFDNGPADGDYVRYIETMAKVAAMNAVHAASVPTASSTSAATGFEPATRPEIESGRSSLATRRGTPPVAVPVARPTAQQVAGEVAVLPALGRALLSMLAGVVVGVIGIAMRPTSVVAILAGIALFIVGFRQASRTTTLLRNAGRVRADRA